MQLIIRPLMNLEQEKRALEQRRLARQKALDRANLTPIIRQIESKIDDKLQKFSSKEQEILIKALAKDAARLDGESAKIGIIFIDIDAHKLVASVGPRIARISLTETLTVARERQQISTGKELPCQSLPCQSLGELQLIEEKDNNMHFEPSLGEVHTQVRNQTSFIDERYRYYMSMIQTQMTLLNAERNVPSFWADAPIERQKELNDQIAVLDAMRRSLHNVSDLVQADQMKYFTRLDSEPFPKTVYDMRIEMISPVVIPESMQTGFEQKLSDASLKKLETPEIRSSGSELFNVIKLLDN